jgi:hypothetical protein
MYFLDQVCGDGGKAKNKSYVEELSEGHSVELTETLREATKEKVCGGQSGAGAGFL